MHATQLAGKAKGMRQVEGKSTLLSWFSLDLATVPDHLLSFHQTAGLSESSANSALGLAGLPGLGSLPNGQSWFWQKTFEHFCEREGKGAVANLLKFAFLLFVELLSLALQMKMSSRNCLT